MNRTQHANEHACVCLCVCMCGVCAVSGSQHKNLCKRCERFVCHFYVLFLQTHTVGLIFSYFFMCACVGVALTAETVLQLLHDIYMHGHQHMYLHECVCVCVCVCEFVLCQVAILIRDPATGQAILPYFKKFRTSTHIHMHLVRYNDFYLFYIFLNFLLLFFLVVHKCLWRYRGASVAIKNITFFQQQQ